VPAFSRLISIVSSTLGPISTRLIVVSRLILLPCGVLWATRRSPVRSTLRRVVSAGTGIAGEQAGPLVFDSGEVDHGHHIVHADLTTVNLREEVNEILMPAEFRVVAFDFARADLP